MAGVITPCQCYIIEQMLEQCVDCRELQLYKYANPVRSVTYIFFLNEVQDYCCLNYEQFSNARLLVF